MRMSIGRYHAWTLFYETDILIFLLLKSSSSRSDVMKSNFEYLLVESDSPVAIITLNRPERRNALSLGLMQELITCLRALGQSQDTHAVIIAASGPVFSAGHDLNELRDRTVGEYRNLFDVCTELMMLVQSIPQPVIAEVQGMATAAGCQLVATCDLAVAAEHAEFATPGVRIGLFCTTPMVALSRAIGRKRALEMLMTGTAISAHTAMEWGLINHVAPAAQLRDKTLELAQRISQASSLTLSVGKQAFYAQIDLEQSKAYAYAKEVMSLNTLAEDAQEGMGAFLEKRAPCWKGR
jgi:enoyl-CoA hydratase/carnithine racemase